MRLIIVEDDVQLNKALKLSLEKEGYAVDSFDNGSHALKHLLINHSNYDVLILDLMLPGKNGTEICKAIRTQDIMIPILMLTAVHDIENKISALDSGADDYLTKPFSIDELAARTRALLRRPQASLKSELEHAGLTLNVSSKEAFFKDKQIKLTLKEFSILEYLLRNKGNVMSRDQILDHVWDFDTNAFSNIVDVHVTNLRKKLEKAHVPIKLETVRGVGFKIK